MLENIIASKSKVKLLRKMIENKDRDFTLEDLTKLTNLSFGTIHPALKDLVNYRIVVLRKVGRSKLYQINENQLLYKELENLFVNEMHVLMNIAREFAKEIDKNDIKNIILFGSVARREFTDKSDVDILVITENPDVVKEKVERSSLVLSKMCILPACVPSKLCI